MTILGMIAYAATTIDGFDHFYGLTDIEHEEYVLTVYYSPTEVEIKRVKKRYYGVDWRIVSGADEDFNEELFCKVFLEMLLEKKRLYEIDEHLKKKAEDDERNYEEWKKTIKHANSMAGY